VTGIDPFTSARASEDVEAEAASRVEEVKRQLEAERSARVLAEKELERFRLAESAGAAAQSQLMDKLK
jgi:hypothetical protein